MVVKIADFGLVKIPDSTFTTVNTEFKGYFNDPSLVVEGFNTYNMLHETYALTRVIYYVLHTAAASGRWCGGPAAAVRSE